ncbi:unnamed protein product [Clonostachys rosea f. rosea IK726]|uniref:Uncharacterized protein n=1 Tax=Clonostachys rosea f. rosea IK726 TaxID=1349383 RepID=A0ACA9UD79_BIOOC|nr:unnamed protein product [Clonostachys rosea f. rosea IK726]
MSCVRAGCT